MITTIREVRRAKGLTLDQVAQGCVPPTTAQTIGRLETGTRTVSVDWLNRIAAALGVTAADLVRLPDRHDLPVAALLGSDGAQAPRHPTVVAPPAPQPGMVAVSVTGTVGNYRAGDILWCAMLAPADFAAALDRDVLVPIPAGRFGFGRCVAIEAGGIQLLQSGMTRLTVADPAWLAQVVTLVRDVGNGGC
jgi:transcriptional regulator with XRE-family HTH domain